MDKDRSFSILTTDPVYTVSQLAGACGTSRSTILRLQEEGLLLPTAYDASGSKRMYSFLDLMKLRQILMLHSYGFTHATIREYFEDNGNYTKLIALLAARQSDIFYFLKEMELRMEEGEALEVEYVFSPSITCHRRSRIHLFPYYDTHKALFTEHMNDIVTKKYAISATRPLFMTTEWSDLAAGASIDGEREYIGFIPLEQKPDNNDPAVVTIPRQRVLSVLIRGPHVDMNRIINLLKNEIEQHRLEVTGPLYLISMVGPHLGLDIPEERYLARIMLPVK